MKTSRGHSAKLLSQTFVGVLAIGVSAFTHINSHAETALANQPLLATRDVPGNLALALSVEFPTAVSVAHIDPNYSPTKEYLGYFDPQKCYKYNYDAKDDQLKYFSPTRITNTHTCTNEWSGNFLNWATTQTIDPFRWVLTGGYRVVDAADKTVLEKAWASGQGGTGNFPDRSIQAADVAGATPFAAGSGPMKIRIQGMGNKMRFFVHEYSFFGKYYNNINRAGNPAFTRTDGAIDFNWGGGSPGTNNDNFSINWTASIKVPTTGNYLFRLRADDGAQLFVDGKSIINQTSYQNNAYQNSKNVNLTAGALVSIVLNHFEGVGGAGVQLQWQKPGDKDFSTIGGGDLYGQATVYNGATQQVGQVFDLLVRVQSCASAALLEKNCVKYGNNYKPEGLIQSYSNKIRYSVFSYLNDTNVYRDGGVLRARQKFVGPMQPVPNSLAVKNALPQDGGPIGQVTTKEWSEINGTFLPNPDAVDAEATVLGDKITNSGVINYINKFGQISKDGYVEQDSVSELYYAAIRYFKNLPNVPEWTNAALSRGVSSAPTRLADGFPVITNAQDPILYSCQKNFILGIGDVHTHKDKNVPGNTKTNDEPDKPELVRNDDTVKPVETTNMIGNLEGLGGGLGELAQFTTDSNSALIAGLAYEAHVKDLRPDNPQVPATNGKQTIDTYWVDVQEYQRYEDNNQFYLATKYGGFTVPENYTLGTALPVGSWHSNNDVVGTNLRPDNYFSGARPDLMQQGLNAAFAKISESIGAFTTAFVTPIPQLSKSGNASFSSNYDPNTWTSDISAAVLNFDNEFNSITSEKAWQGKTFSQILEAQLSNGGWDKNRRIATWGGIPGSGIEFRATGGSSSLPMAYFDAGGVLDPSYVPGNDSVNFLNYLRGDRLNEIGNTDTKSTLAYRSRKSLLGDIVDSKVTPNGPPNFPYSDTTNPGYADFAANWKARPTVLFVGSNDGFLHGIDGALDSVQHAGYADNQTSATYGQELFAYVPRALFNGPTAPNVDGLASLGNPAYVHHFMVNATPMIFDVDFTRVPDNLNVKPTDFTNVNPDWRSVLVSGLGKGGKAFFALDVTDPVGMSKDQAAFASKVLWEFDNSDPLVAGRLGFSYGTPLIVKTKKFGWTAIFTSGYNNSDGQGWFFFVNPKTGKLLEKVTTGTVPQGTDAGLAQAEAFIVDGTDGTADALYAGDLSGNLWRLDITSDQGLYPAPVNIAVFHRWHSGK